MRLRSILTIVLACVAMFLPMSRAMAQAEFPKDVVEAATLSAEHKQIIDKMIADRIPGLANADHVALKKSRDELLRPFRNPLVSVAFRQYFSDNIRVDIKKNADAKGGIALNALIIAGEVATGDTVAILEGKLKDTEESIRFAAVRGLERTMGAVANRNPAIPANRVEALVAKLGEVLVDPTTSSNVMGSCVRGLSQAMSINRPGFNVRSLAVRTLTDSIGKISERTDAPASVLLQAVDVFRIAFQGNEVAGQLEGDSLNQAAAMSGQLLSWGACQIKKGRLPVDQPEARAEAARVIRAAESTILLASRKVNKALLPANLGSEFEKATAANDRTFFSSLLTFLKPLNEAPFNIKPDVFLQCDQGK